MQSIKTIRLIDWSSAATFQTPRGTADWAKRRTGRLTEMEMEMAFFLDTGRRGPLERFTSNQPRQAVRQGWLVWALALLRHRRKWAADRRALLGMNSHLRRDIGVSHESMRAELRRSFWDDPALRSVRPGWPFGR